ncbi:MAG: MotA/TolQ/ExbB proton channel family protein [Capsulimonadales bacterium]|nr:MotA/TolQ/ExbB proton channel family protein [Capsulimonadales bacterium]
MLQKGFEFLLRGGWIMWPLFVCAILSVAVMIERTWVLRRQEREADTASERVLHALRQGNAENALTEARKSNGAVGKVLAAGLSRRSQGSEAVEQAMQAAGLRQLRVLNERLGWLDTIITMAPLLGLLGTVTGMISAFQVVATASGASAAPAITGGVAEALIATATGLAIAVATLPVYNHLTEKVKELTNDMEAAATETQSLLAGLPNVDAEAASQDGSAAFPEEAIRASATATR